MRLIRAYSDYDEYDGNDYELNSRADEITDLYGMILDDVRVIETAAERAREQLQGIAFEAVEDITAEITDEMTSISEAISNISQHGYLCKQVGIHNEEQLKLGNKYIKDLEGLLHGLEGDLDELKRQRSDLEAYINQANTNIDDIQTQLNELEDMERKGSRLRRVANTFPYICAVHDDISAVADEIGSYLEDISDMLAGLKLYDGDETEFEAEVANYVSDIKNALDEISKLAKKIESNMDVGTNMNERMDNGIARKSDTLYTLIQSMQELSATLEGFREENNELQGSYDELQNLLEELESMVE